MRSFFRLAALVLIGATGVYLYELGGGEIMPAGQMAEAPKRAPAVAISKSPPARVKSTRTIDRSRPMPPRPPGLERIIEARGGSDFPVLVPGYFARDEAMTRRYDVRLRLTDDGYTSVLTLPDYDVVIYGTRSAFRKQDVVRAETRASASRQSNQTTPVDTPVSAPVRADYTMSFEDGEDGRSGSLSFGRYGVDYHIEFFCRGGAENCIDGAGASAFLAALFAVQEPTRKVEKRAARVRVGIRIGGATSEPDSDPASRTLQRRNRP